LFVTSAAYSLLVDILTRQDFHECTVAMCNDDCVPACSIPS